MLLEILKCANYVVTYGLVSPAEGKSFLPSWLQILKGIGFEVTVEIFLASENSRGTFWEAMCCASSLHAQYR